MPVNAKGRLKYQDFLSRFSTERVPSPPMAAGDSGDSTVAQRGSSAPEVSQGTRSTLHSPRGPRAGLKSRSYPSVSSQPDVCPISPQADPGTLAGCFSLSLQVTDILGS